MAWLHSFSCKMKSTLCLGALVLAVLLVSSSAELSPFLFGRHRDGFLLPPKNVTGRNARLVTESTFTQKVDHFDATNTATFEQRYFTNNQYHVAGGPAFLFIGGESTASSSWMTYGAWHTWAQKYNAFMFQVEHRYYGSSRPTADLTTPNLKFLSSRQAVEDLVTFRDYAEAQYNLQGAKWIVFGGSYAGNLAAWAAEKHGNIFVGAVASSGPVLAELDFDEYLGVCDDVISAVSPTCHDNVKAATDAIVPLLQNSAGWTELSSLFKTCEPLDGSNADDVSGLYAFLAGNFQGVIQYQGISGSITSTTLCDIMDDTSRGDPIQRYADVNSLLLFSGGYSCIDVKYQSTIDYISGTTWLSAAVLSGYRQWFYQTCSEFGYYQTTDLATQPFGNGIPLSYYLKQCEDVYGADFSAAAIQGYVDSTNGYFGGRTPDAHNVVFPNGNVDPWHALGVLSDLSADAVAIYISGTAHCADMYEDSFSDPAGLTAARQEIDQLIASWLAA